MMPAGLVVRWCSAQSPATANDNSIASAGGSMHVARVSSVVHQLVCVAVIIVQGTALLIITDDSATHLMPCTPHIVTARDEEFEGNVRFMAGGKPSNNGGVLQVR